MDRVSLAERSKAPARLHRSLLSNLQMALSMHHRNRSVRAPNVRQSQIDERYCQPARCLWGSRRPNFQGHSDYWKIQSPEVRISCTLYCVSEKHSAWVFIVNTRSIRLSAHVGESISCLGNRLQLPCRRAGRCRGMGRNPGYCARCDSNNIEYKMAFSEEKQRKINELQ